MKIKTRLTISTITSVCLAFAIGSVILLATYKVSLKVEHAKITDELFRMINEMKFLTEEYLLHQVERVQPQWESKYQDTSKLLRVLESGGYVTKDVINEMQRDQKDIKMAFDNLILAYERKDESDQEFAALSLEYKERLAGQLITGLNELIYDSLQLSKEQQSEIDTTKTRTMWFIVLFVIIMVSVTGILSFIVSRNISKPITKLQEGTEIVGSGNLDFRIGTTREDEIGKLSRAFDYMTEQLKKSNTSLQESEHRFRELAENINQVFWMETADGSELLYASPAYEQIWGRTLQSFYDKPKSWIDTIHPDDRQRVADSFSQCQIRGKYAEEFRIIRPNGEIRWIFDRGFPIQDESGNVYRIAGIAEDITERKQIEEDLKIRTAELERSNEELQQFAYVASHDLQEPLRMVASYTQLLGKRYKGKLDADADEFIDYAVDGANRMQALINDLLTYSRISASEKLLKRTDCNVVLNLATSNLQSSIDESGASITHDDLPTVIADKNQFVQLFQNLIGNSIKFHGKEPPRIHVSAQQIDGQVTKQSETRIPKSNIRNGWLFSVSDNGIGINPEYGNRIFVIFQRLHGRGKYPGSGIGLTICKKIVERYGGDIWVESEPGKGSTFYFTIPS